MVVADREFINNVATGVLAFEGRNAAALLYWPTIIVNVRITVPLLRNCKG